MYTVIKNILTLLIGAIQFFLGLHFVLRLFGANPSAPFVRFVNETSRPILIPFERIFGNEHVAGFVFDFSTLFALFVYLFLGYVLLEIIERLNRS